MIKIITRILTIAQMVLSIALVVAIIRTLFERWNTRKEHLRVVICAALIIGISELVLAIFGQGSYIWVGLWLGFGAGWWLYFIRRKNGSQIFLQ